MLVYLIRHAKAHKDSPSGHDADRRLNPRGERQAQWLGATLASHEHPPRAILTSPAERALQTARAVEAAVGCPLHIIEQLSTRHDAQHYALALEPFDRLPCVALVAHNPTLELLAAGLLRGGNQEPPAFRTGQAVLLDIDLADERPARLVEVLRLDDED